MKKKAISIAEACIVLLSILVLSSCGSRIDYSLPANPIEFYTETFINPNNPDDKYISIEYNGRTYIPYGTINGIAPKYEMGDCLGFIVQDGVKMEDLRIFLLAGDPDANYLGRFETEGVMNQPDFFRAIDTVGQEIATPKYIDDLGYDFWKNVPSDNPTYVSEQSDSTEKTDSPSVGGPYGEISVNVPDTWSYEPVHVDEEGLMYGLYGLILKPIETQEGQIELVCADSFGVCGTGLSQEDITLATVKAHVGTYDDHEHWDFITIGGGNPQIVVQHTDCDSWTDEMWDEVMAILDTMIWNMDKTEGGIGRYTQESEDDTIAVSMSVSNVTPSGLTVHLRQYDKRDTEELTYGEEYQLERFNGTDWEEVPQIIDNGAFNAIGYALPAEGEAEIETNWEWLYGRLSPGRYRITKTIVDDRKVGNNPLYFLKSEFYIMDSDIVRTYEVTDGALSEEYIKNSKLVTLVRYYEMTNGTWRTDDNTYKYRLEITGRMGGGAVKDSTFVYLSNIEDISFERAYMAAGLSSNMDDYFDPSEAVLVAMK